MDPRICIWVRSLVRVLTFCYKKLLLMQNLKSTFMMNQAGSTPSSSTTDMLRSFGAYIFISVLAYLGGVYITTLSAAT
jgi:hypothetical protein